MFFLNGVAQPRLSDLNIDVSKNWNNKKLTALAAGVGAGESLRYEQLIALYLLLTGGTLTGNLEIEKANPTLILDATTGSAYLQVHNAGALRLGFSFLAESWQFTDWLGGAERVIIDRTTGNITKVGYIILKITDIDGATEGQIWYDASENKVKFKTAVGVETITSV